MVKELKDKRTGEQFALKIIDKSLVGNSSAPKNEVDILKRVSHTNIITLKDIFDSRTHLFLVMELVRGGELFDEIVHRGAFSEKDAADLLRQVIQAVDYLHSLGIVHRDLKPENLLFATPDEGSLVKIADFGLSKIVGEQALLKTACGTPGYVAPEVLQCAGYDKAVDMWACGVILYILLCGFPPFYDENLTVLYEQILAGDYDFPAEYWSQISPSAKDLIRHLLAVNPAERYTAKQTLKHPWLVGHDSYSKQIIVFEEMKKFNAQRKLKVAVSALIAKNRFASAAMSTATTSSRSKEQEDDNDVK